MRGAVPVHFDTEREVVEVMLKSLAPKPVRETRLLQIANTLHLSECLASTALLPELERASDVEITGPPAPMTFTEDGRLKFRLAGQPGSPS
jgi:hypothetical protein